MSSLGERCQGRMLIMRQTAVKDRRSPTHGTLNLIKYSTIEPWKTCRHKMHDKRCVSDPDRLRVSWAYRRIPTQRKIRMQMQTRRRLCFVPGHSSRTSSSGLPLRALRTTAKLSLYQEHTASGEAKGPELKFTSDVVR